MSVYQRKARFDDYIMQDYLGSGSSAEVWKVTDPDGGVLALKIFAPGSGLDDFGRTVFREEFEKTFDLHHPNILQALRYGDFDDKPFIIMPLSEKGSLMRELRRRMFIRKNEGKTFENLFSEQELVLIIHQLADALSYLQQHGIVHRDLKPDNMLIFGEGAEDRYVLTDFGISSRIRRTIQRQTRQQINTDSGMTPAYAAPELFRGQIHPLSDVFSLGISIYEMACGEIPAVMSGVGIGLAMINGATIEPLPGTYSVRFRELLDLCLQEVPDHRCSPDDLVEWTGHFLSKGGWPPIRRQAPQTPVEILAAGTPPVQDSEGMDADQAEELVEFLNRYGAPPSIDPERKGSQSMEKEGPATEGQAEGIKPVAANADESLNLPGGRPGVEEGSPAGVSWVRASLWAGGTLLIAVALFFGLSAHLREKAQARARHAWETGQLELATLEFSQLCARTGEAGYCRMDSLLTVLGERYEMTAFQSRRSRIRSVDNGLYGFISPDADMVIPPQFADAGGFNPHGFAWVAKDLPEGRRYGMVDTTGHTVIPIDYSEMTIDHDRVLLNRNEEYRFDQLKSKSNQPL